MTVNRKLAELRGRAFTLRQLLKDAAANGRDAGALQALSRLPGPYVPWTSAAMRPSAVATLVNETYLNERRHIVECGPGVSTIFLARALREVGGHLYAIEEDAAWAERIARWLEHEGTAGNVTVIHAPLEARDGQHWYAQAAVAVVPDGIDLLVIDGPKASEPGQRLARYPALPYFASKLASDATVVLDDILRTGEQEVVARWHQELGREFEIRGIYDNLAVSRPASAFYA